MTPNETFSFLEKAHILPTTKYDWRPFTATAIYVETPGNRFVYRLDLTARTVTVFKADPRNELSEHFTPDHTINLTPAQMTLLQQPGEPVLQ